MPSPGMEWGPFEGWYKKMRPDEKRSFRESMKTQQGKLCALCGEPFKLKSWKFETYAVVDHEHSSDRIRGLIHEGCNKDLRVVEKRSREWITNSFDYLARSKIATRQGAINYRDFKQRMTHSQQTALESDLMRVQGMTCPLCCGPLRSYQVDHEHASGRIRGLLHEDCNLDLGNIEKRSPDWVKHAYLYLQRN